MEKQNSDPQSLSTNKESQSSKIDMEKEVGGTEIADDLEESKINRSQTQSNSASQNSLGTTGKNTSGSSPYVI